MNNLIKISCSLLLVLSMLILPAIPIYAVDGSGPIPFSQSYETNANMDSIIGVLGWSGSISNYAVVTNISGTTNLVGSITNFSACTYPLNSETHTKIIKLDTEGKEITNSVTHNGATDPAIWLDTMLQATRWSDDNPPTLTNDSAIQALVYVNSNGFLTIYHAACTDVWGTKTNQFTTLSHSEIGSNDWIRLTIACSYSDNDAQGFASFQVSLNGAPLSSSYGYDNETDIENAGQPGSWHLMANQPDVFTQTDAHDISYFGTGYFDDFVVTNGLPIYTVPIIQWLIAHTYSPSWGGSISPSTNFYVTNNGTANLYFLTNAYWDVASILDNGSPQGVDTSYTINPVTGPHTVAVTFAQQTVTNGTIDVPKWWLYLYTGTNTPDSNAVTNDSDGDGYSNWEEWLAGTDPTNINRFFRITDHYNRNGTNYVEWITDAIDPGLPPFDVVRKTDLTNATWDIVTNVTRISGSNRTNVWVEADPPPTPPAFYRIVATNN